MSIPTANVSALQSVAAVEASKNQFSRDFRGRSIFDFCNSIAPQRTSRRLFNHLVGEGKQRRRKREAERLGSFQIHVQPKLSRQLHRQIGRISALEYLVHQNDDVAIGRVKIRRIRHQATHRCKAGVRREGRQLLFECKLGDALAREAGLQSPGARRAAAPALPHHPSATAQRRHPTPLRHGAGTA